MDVMNDSEKTFTIRTCRICLDSKCDNFVLLDEESGWFRLFEYCFDVVINIQDEPRVLCEKCADNVKKYAEFKEQCCKTHEIWKSITVNVKCYTDKLGVCKVEYEEIDNYNRIATSPDILLDDDSNFLNNEETLNKVSSDIKDDHVENSFLKETKVLKNSDIKIELKIENTDVEEIQFPKYKKTEDTIKHTNTKVKHVYKCKNCEKKYEKLKCFKTHIKLCKTKKRKKGEHNAPNNFVVWENNWQLQNANGVCKTEDTNSQITKNIPDKSEFYCGICELTFENFDDMCKHLNEHWSSNDLKCKLCEFVSDDLAVLFVHRHSHGPCKNKSSFLCHFCGGKIERTLVALQFHYRKVHLKKNGGYCAKCNKEYPTLRNWKKHNRLHHSTGGYICDICGKRYMYKYLIKEHMLNHLEQAKYICDTCGKNYTRASYLKLHIESVHTKSDPVKCDHCNRMFKSEHTLRVHQKLLNKEKSLKCEVCPKTYPTPNLLKAHMVMHSDERPYCCNICGVRYKAKCQLKLHMMRHTGYKPFKCELCAKSFATAGQLRVHSSVHTGVRAHKCSYCVRSFHEKKQLTAHCASRHKSQIIE